MYEKVRRCDIILIPRIPEWHFVTIAKATENWNTGYEFEIDAEMNDYGHIFPARYLKHFSRNNENVRSNVRSTLRCRSRFWSMNPHKNSLQMLVELDCDLTSGFLQMLVELDCDLMKIERIGLEELSLM